jgi:hypothetical protein
METGFGNVARAAGEMRREFDAIHTEITRRIAERDANFRASGGAAAFPPEELMAQQHHGERLADLQRLCREMSGDLLRIEDRMVFRARGR